MSECGCERGVCPTCNPNKVGFPAATRPDPDPMCTVGLGRRPEAPGLARYRADARNTIRDVILNAETVGLGAGLTPREYAERLADRVMTALSWVGDR